MMNAEPSGTKRGTTLLYPHESYLIRGAYFAIYQKFRNTQKESVYQNALLEELKHKGLKIEREKQLPIYHLGVKVGVYTPDLLINGAIIIELKAKPFLHQEDVRQFWYYLKNSQFKLGFLVNFGEPNGVKIVRRVYDTARQRSSASSSAARQTCQPRLTAA
ncbi:MAG: GxxExxY protein [Patescibacteria group bacterium]